jgi:hypothetical protein
MVDLDGNQTQGVTEDVDEVFPPDEFSLIK